MCPLPCRAQPRGSLPRPAGKEQRGIGAMSALWLPCPRGSAVRRVVLLTQHVRTRAAGLLGSVTTSRVRLVD
jgi:hypothetical protein